MSDSQVPSTKPKGSLWTTPASAASTSYLQGLAVDKSVTAENLRQAVAKTRGRAAAFATRVSNEVLRKSVD